MKLDKIIEDFFEKVFHKWATIIANHTLKVLLITIAVISIIIAGIYFQKEYDKRDNLWSPEGNQSEKNLKKANNVFPEKNRMIGMLITNKNGNSILTKSQFVEIKQMEDILYNFVNKKDGEKYKDQCFNKVCMSPMSPTNFVSSISDAQALTDAQLLQRINTGINVNTGQIVLLDSMFKGNNINPISQQSNGQTTQQLTSSKSALMINYIEMKLSRDKMESLELAIQDMVLQSRRDSKYTYTDLTTNQQVTYEFKEVDFSLYTLAGQYQSVDADINSDLGLIAFAVILVALYCLIFLGSFSPIHSRIFLSSIGLLMIGLSYMCANGFLSYLGVKTSIINGILPFLLIGIGADDIFVIVNGIDQQNCKLDVKTRFIKTMKHAGPSITITSFTNILAFFLGATSTLKALQSFCIYTAVGILFLFLLTITFFSSIFYYDLIRQERLKGDCCGLCFCSENTIICCNGVFIQDNHREFIKIRQNNGVQAIENTQEDQKITQTQIHQNEQSDENSSYSYVQRFLQKYYSKFIMKTYIRIIVLVVYTVFIAFSIYQATQIVEDFQTDYFISRSSETYRYLQLNRKYFQKGLLIDLYIENGSEDFTTESYQKSVQQLFTDINSCKGCSEPWIQEQVSSWYNVFLQRSKSLSGSNTIAQCQNSYDSTNNIVKQSMFMGCLQALFDAKDTQMYQQLSKLKIENNKIVASRQSFYIKSIKSASIEGLKYLKDIRRLENNGPKTTYTFNYFYFNFEQYLTFKEDTYRNIGLSLASVVVILILTTGNLKLTFFILLCVFLVILFLYALINMWDLTLNSISVVNIILALGLSVDYSAHIAHSYQLAKHKSLGKALSASQLRIQKVQKSLSTIGSSVFHGSFSTFLAIITLSFAKSYGFVVFFKMWFGIIIFGVSNGFILLPVLLSFIGPLNHDDVQYLQNANQQSPKVHDEQEQLKVVSKQVYEENIEEENI